jgi:hypothetical protein
MEKKESTPGDGATYGMTNPADAFNRMLEAATVLNGLLNGITETAYQGYDNEEYPKKDLNKMSNATSDFILQLADIMSHRIASKAFEKADGVTKQMIHQMA